MRPALPDEPSGEPFEQPSDQPSQQGDPQAFPQGEWISAGEVGDFERGTPLSRWAFARYLVGRAIGESVGQTLLVLAVLVLAVAAAAEWLLRSTFLAVLLAVVALGVLLLRAMLRAVLRRLTEADRYGEVETRLRRLVSDTRGDVLRELRRVGLPSHTVTLPLLAVRLVGRQRASTLARLRDFDVDRAVPRARLDELHMLLGGR